MVNQGAERAYLLGALLAFAFAPTIYVQETDEDDVEQLKTTLHPVVPQECSPILLSCLHQMRIDPRLFMNGLIRVQSVSVYGKLIGIA